MRCKNLYNETVSSEPNINGHKCAVLDLDISALHAYTNVYNERNVLSFLIASFTIVIFSDHHLTVFLHVVCSDI